MTKEELLYRIKDIEWDDFEAKEALDKLPANVWESVSANVFYYRQKLANNGGLEAQNVGLESADSKQNSMYNGGMPVGLETQNGGLKIDYEARAILTARQSVILKAIEVRPSHTAKSLSDLLHLAQRTIERELAFLRTNGFVDKQGSKRFGIWMVLK